MSVRRGASRDLDENEQHQRKRVRKGTKSCWECKRRKVKCQLSSEKVEICSGCLGRGTKCLSQEYPEDEHESSGSHIGERLGRMERLLEKMVQKMEHYEEEENATKIHTPESMSKGDVPTPNITSNPYENAPLAPILNSLFDNPVLGRRETTNQSQTPPAQSQSIGGKTSGCRPPSKIERIRDVLVELFPSQEATNKLCSFDDCWLLLHSLTTHSGDLLLKPTEQHPNHSFNLAYISKEDPATISQTLLYIAVCLQQLPPLSRFDVSQLQLGQSVDSRVNKIISTVSGLVVSDDELVSTPEGLECLIVLGIFHTNAGNLRRAWLTFRRALNIAQLLGLSKGGDDAARGTSFPRGTKPGGHDLWATVMQADRYLGLLLGMPIGAPDIEIAERETFQNPNVDRDHLFTAHLTNIAGGIMKRNQNEDIHAFAHTQQLDEKLELLTREMPASWWEVPAYLETVNKTAVAAAQFDRVMIQIWYFQLQSYLHLPFMVRAATERRYEYSKFTCLRASREIINRWLALRRSGTRSFCCKIIDFASFTSCVTLLLSCLEKSVGDSVAVAQQKLADKALVQNAVNSMEEYAVENKASFQSAEVIKTLLAANSTDGGNLRLTIPYFGTISIARTAPSTQISATTVLNENLSLNCPPKATQPQQQQHWCAFANPSSYDITQNSLPVVSFKSSHFPPLETGQQPLEDWGPSEADTIFFDSLLNTDLEGNWIF